jgi:hypothetical protein
LMNFMNWPMRQPNSRAKDDPQRVNKKMLQ